MKIRGAFLRMLASRSVSLVLMVAGFAALGRLLEPQDFGHFALASAIFFLAQTVCEFGLRQFLIRRDSVSREDVGSAVGLSLAIAAVLTIACLAAAWGLSGTVLPAPAAEALVPLALVLVVGPFRLGAEAMLQRSLDFSVFSVVEVVRVAADVATAVTLAALGYGPTALALGLAANQIVGLLIIVVGSGAGHRMRPRLGGWASFARFGRQVTTIQILPRMTDLALTAILTGAIGPVAVGLFNRAETVFKIMDRVLFEGIEPVVLPALSDSLRRGVAPFQVYLAKVDFLVVVCWPGFALIALLAEPLVALLLGPGWDRVVPLVHILAAMGLFMPIAKMSNKFFVAIDASGTYLRIQTTQQLVRLGLCGPAALVSLEAFAAAYVAAAAAKAAAVSLAIKRRFASASAGYGRIALRGGIVTGTTLAGGGGTLALGLDPLPTLLVALPLAGMGWLAGLLAVRHLLVSHIRAAALDARRLLFAR
jgi:O-antigen/teichoic acid export membrane protein